MVADMGCWFRIVISLECVMGIQMSRSLLMVGGGFGSSITLSIFNSIESKGGNMGVFEVKVGVCL